MYFMAKNLPTRALLSKSQKHFSDRLDPLRPSDKRCCAGYFHNTMVNLATRRAEPIPEWIIEKHGI
jgi:hypothetical protein